MSRTLVFDTDYYRLINERRKDFLNELLPSLLTAHDLRTALDAGCGIGFFSHYLAGLGLKVTAFDARAENIAEAKRRLPEIDFYVHDLEDHQVQELGSFDLVLCFGLLYHLENPFRAIRNLHALTGRTLLVESVITPHPLPMAALVEESQGKDQSLRHIALVLSETCLVKMLYRAGFPAVYRVTQLPDHEDFRATLARKRRRTILVASRIRLSSPLPHQVLEPQTKDLWQTSWGSQAQHLKRFLKKASWVVRLLRLQRRHWDNNHTKE